MKRFFYFCILAFLAISCKQQDDLTQTQVSWSGTHPFSIPLKIREQKIAKGNLVANSSFEQGKYYALDSSFSIFDVPGWSRIGTNVYWVSSDNEYFNTSEVSEGNHAIKIVRDKIDETEKEGDGIISEFIKVIPGNYDFELSIRLENIESQLSRLSAQLLNTIDVRLQFYDKNKIEINSIWYSEFYDRNIDNSFKAINIARFSKIDSTGWVTLIGRSSWEPFALENIPPDAYYAKIKIAFKGKGKVWIDNVSLKYTTRNLSLYEQVISYLKEDYDKADLIIPTPRFIEKKGKVYFNVTDTNKNISQVVIWYPANLRTQYFSLANQLKSSFSEFFEKVNNVDTIPIPTIKVVNYLDLDTLTHHHLIIKINNKFPEGDSLRIEAAQESESAYAILLTDTLPKSFLIYGKQKEAVYNAIQTFKQLFDNEKGTLSLVNIEDFPAFGNRAILFDTILSSISAIDDLAAYKANMVYLPMGQERTVKKSKLTSRIIDFETYCKSDQDYKRNRRVTLIQLPDNNVRNRISSRDLLRYKYEILLPNATNCAMSKYGDVSCNALLQNATVFYSGNTTINAELDYFDVKLFKDKYDNIAYYDQRYLLPSNEKLTLIFNPFLLNITDEAFHVLNDKMIVGIKDNNLFNLLNVVTALDFMWNPEDYDPVFSLYKALYAKFDRDFIHRLMLIDKTIFEINQLTSENMLPKMQDLKSVEILKHELLLYLQRVNKIDSVTFNSTVLSRNYSILK